MAGEIGADVREDEPPDAGGMSHAGGALGPALAAGLADEPLGDSLGQRGAEDLQPVLATDALIPAAKQEAGVVDVVVEVVVREEEVVHLRGPQAGFDELVRGRRAAVEHGKPAAAEVEDV